MERKERESNWYHTKSKISIETFHNPLWDVKFDADVYVITWRKCSPRGKRAFHFKKRANYTDMASSKVETEKHFFFKGNTYVIPRGGNEWRNQMGGGDSWQGKKPLSKKTNR